MSTTHPITAAFAAASLLAASATAQDLRPEYLPRDTSYLLHIDARRAAELIGIEKFDDDFEEARDRLKSALGFDPLRDVLSITAFGSSDEHDDASILVITNDRLDGAMRTLDDEGAVERFRSRRLDFVRLAPQGVARALGVRDEKIDTDGKSPVLYISKLDDDRRAVLIGEDAGSLLPSARVLDDDAPSLADAEEPNIDVRNARDAIVYLEVTTSLSKFTRDTPASRIGDKVRRIAMAITAANDELTVKLVADTGSKEDARNVTAILDGLRALITLTDLDEEVPEEVREVIQSIEVRANGSEVHLQLHIEMEVVQSVLDEAKGDRRRARRRR